MLQHNNNNNTSGAGQKPSIPPKPKLAQKPSTYVIVGSSENSTNSSTSSSSQPISAKSQRRNDNNPFTMPSSSLPPPTTTFSDCNDSCCGFLNDAKAAENHHHPFGFTNVSNFHLHDDNVGEFEDHIKFADRILSQSFDTSSSSPSSGGSRELDIVTKTVAAFEVFEKEEENGHHTNSLTMPVTSLVVGCGSKIREMKSKLFERNNSEKHPPSQLNSDKSILINRQQVQKSSKELEKILGMRMEKENRMKTMTMTSTSASVQEKLAKRLSRSFDDIDDDNNFTTAKSIHKKLNEEMKLKSDKIKEKYLIEKVPVQRHYKDFMVLCSFYRYYCVFISSLRLFRHSLKCKPDMENFFMFRISLVFHDI